MRKILMMCVVAAWVTGCADGVIKGDFEVVDGDIIGIDNEQRIITLSLGEDVYVPESITVFDFLEEGDAVEIFYEDTDGRRVATDVIQRRWTR